MKKVMGLIVSLLASVMCLVCVSCGEENPTFPKEPKYVMVEQYVNGVPQILEYEYFTMQFKENGFVEIVSKKAGEKEKISQATYEKQDNCYLVSNYGFEFKYIILDGGNKIQVVASFAFSTCKEVLELVK